MVIMLGPKFTSVLFDDIGIDDRSILIIHTRQCPLFQLSDTVFSGG